MPRGRLDGDGEWRDFVVYFDGVDVEISWETDATDYPDEWIRLSPKQMEELMQFWNQHKGERP